MLLTHKTMGTWILIEKWTKPLAFKFPTTLTPYPDMTMFINKCRHIAQQPYSQQGVYCHLLAKVNTLGAIVVCCGLYYTLRRWSFPVRGGGDQEPEESLEMWANNRTKQLWWKMCCSRTPRNIDHVFIHDHMITCYRGNNTWVHLVWSNIRYRWFPKCHESEKITFNLWIISPKWGTSCMLLCKFGLKLGSFNFMLFICYVCVLLCIVYILNDYSRDIVSCISIKIKSISYWNITFNRIHKWIHKY